MVFPSLKRLGYSPWPYLVLALKSWIAVEPGSELRHSGSALALGESE